jgi:hypothetical protein
MPIYKLGVNYGKKTKSMAIGTRTIGQPRKI